jgi:hypothetical protein
MRIIFQYIALNCKKCACISKWEIFQHDLGREPNELMSKLKMNRTIHCCIGHIVFSRRRATQNMRAHTSTNHRLIQFITKLNRHDPLIRDRFAVPSPYQSIKFSMHDCASVTTPTVVLVLFLRPSTVSQVHICTLEAWCVDSIYLHWVCDARIWSRYFKSNQTHHGVFIQVLEISTTQSEHK